MPFFKTPHSEVWVSVGNGHGSTANKIRRFSTVRTNTGNAITYADSAANGASFTINQNGLYSICYTDRYLSSATAFGVTLNSASLTTSILSLSQPEVLGIVNGSGVSTLLFSIVKRFSVGDVIRPHTDGTPDGTGAANQFQIIKIGN